MRISFDLDNTLICYQKDVPREPNRVPFFLKLFLKFWINEPLRLGTCKLIKYLKERQCEILIYTSSSRPVWQIRLWLCCYGIHVKTVINHNVYNERQVGYPPDYIFPSKNPRLFGIDLHIDDSERVKLEGKVCGFQVLLISPEDGNWTDKVIEAVRHYYQLQ